jgi:hypothetical protein
MLLAMHSTSLADTSFDASAKSVSTGTRVALIGTLIPSAIGAYLLAIEPGSGSDEEIIAGGAWAMGVLIGPGLGHLYAHKSSRFLSGAGTRLAVGAVGLIPLSVAIGTNTNSDKGKTVVMAGLAVGAAALAYLMHKDIRNTSRSVNDYNAKQARAGTHLKPFAGLGRHGMQAGLTLTF